MWARELLKQGDAAEAARLFARSIRLGTSSALLLGAIVVDFGRPDVALEVARGDPRWLAWLVQRFRADEAQKTLVAEARKELLGQLRDAIDRTEVPTWMLAKLGQLEEEEGNDREALALCRRYLALEPISGVRLSLAQLLRKAGELDAARQEVRRFLNCEPGHAGAKRMLAELGP